jgi:glycyl-tRNA synthetase beta chain
MGRYYAHHDHESAEVAAAIEQHYYPKAAGGELPGSAVAVSVALADRLDTLVGIFGIGLQPTGEKDPFGLRRAALAVVRILAEKNLALDVVELLERARSLFPAGVVAESVAQDLHGFMLERLKPYLREKNFEPDEIDAVAALAPRRFDQVLPRLKALQEFRLLPEAQALAAANKRIRNILKQAEVAPGTTVNTALLTEVAEQILARELDAMAASVTPLYQAYRFTEALKDLARLRPAVDAFFDQVMVMAEDKAVRANRLALLNRLSNLFLEAADISRLQG